MEYSFAWAETVQSLPCNDGVMGRALNSSSAAASPPPPSFLFTEDNASIDGQSSVLVALNLGSRLRGVLSPSMTHEIIYRISALISMSNMLLWTTHVGPTLPCPGQAGQRVQQSLLLAPT